MNHYSNALRLFAKGIMLAFLLEPCSVFAGTMGDSEMATRWRFVVAAGGGASFVSDVGQSQFVPIQNLVIDQYYKYSIDNGSQTKGFFDVFLGMERALKPKWALQLGLGYTQLATYNVQGALVQGADLQSEDSYAYQYKLKPKQLLAESKLLYDFKTRFHPYALLGLGVSFNTAEDFSTTVPPFLTFTREYQNHTNTSFAYSVGAGIDIDVTQHLRVGIGYRFADFGTMKLGAAHIDTSAVSGTLSQSNFQSNMALAQITFIK